MDIKYGESAISTGVPDHPGVAYLLFFGLYWNVFGAIDTKNVPIQTKLECEDSQNLVVEIGSASDVILVGSVSDKMLGDQH